MSKKCILVLALVFFCSKFGIARADVMISEVKYSPTASQWVEIYNDTESDVDITAYKLLDSSVKTGHAISAVEGGPVSIPKHGYGIVAKTPADFSGTSFPVFKSSLNIKVSSDMVTLKNAAGDDVSSVSIDGSATDGNSFQTVDGLWVASVPTPGATNQISEFPEETDTDTGDEETSDDSDSSTNTSGSSSTSSKNTATKTVAKPKPPAVQKMKAVITSKSLVYAGIPFTITGEAFGIHGEELFDGKYFWNFGDGDSRETKTAKADKFTHTYFYPGEYAVAFEHYPDYFTDTPDVTAAVTIKVTIPEVSISSVGDEKDFFVELSNNAEDPADISNWILASDRISFKIPSGTTVASKKKIIIPPRVSGFSASDKSSLKLLNPPGEVNFSFMPLPLGSIATPSAGAAPTMALFPKIKVITPVAFAQGQEQEEAGPTFASFIPTEALLARAAGDKVANPLGLTGEPSHSPVGVLIFFLLLVGIAGGAVYYIRRKKPVLKVGEDFEIADE